MNALPRLKPELSDLAGECGRLTLYRWPNPAARYVAVLAHGAGEHLGRYEHVAAALVAGGGAVWGADHHGHGRSDGERMDVADPELLVADVQRVVLLAKAAHPGLPVVLIGHSMGGMIAARYAQQHASELRALVLSAPLIGPWPVAATLLAMDPMPEMPIDPAVLSRDPQVGADYAADPLVFHGALPRAALQGAVNGLAAIDTGPSLGDLPTLWMHGQEDALVPAEISKEGLAKIRGRRFGSHLYPGARHEIFNETNNAEVLRDLLAFIDGILALPR